jgi:hypothetical protein
MAETKAKTAPAIFTDALEGSVSKMIEKRHFRGSHGSKSSASQKKGRQFALAAPKFS